MRPPKILDHDLKFLKTLGAGIDAANRGIVDAQAALGRAAIQVQSSQAAMNTFMDHLGELYGLKPNDGIDPEGNIHYVDPGWAQEAAIAAQAEAVRQQDEAENTKATEDTNIQELGVIRPTEEEDIPALHPEDTTAEPVAIVEVVPAPEPVRKMSAKKRFI